MVDRDVEMVADAIVDALSRADASDEHTAEILWNAAVNEPEALRLAGEKFGELYSTTALQAVALGFVVSKLSETWRTMPRASLGDVLKVVDGETRGQVIRMLDSAGWDISGLV